jgi:hypothetical protein
MLAGLNGTDNVDGDPQLGWPAFFALRHCAVSSADRDRLPDEPSARLPQ